MTQVEIPEEKTLVLNVETLEELEWRLRDVQPKWREVQALVLLQGVDTQVGDKLAIPSTYPAVTGIGASPPAWVLVDVPQAQIRGVLA